MLLTQWYSNCRLETSLNLTDDLAGLEPTGIPDLPKTNKVSGRKPRIIAQTMSGSYQVISCGTKVTLDPVMKKIGIWIPEMVSFIFCECPTCILNQIFV